jgi:hypothetical protein
MLCLPESALNSAFSFTHSSRNSRHASPLGKISSSPLHRVCEPCDSTRGHLLRFSTPRPALSTLERATTQTKSNQVETLSVSESREFALSCIISVNRAHQTIFSLTSGSLCGLVPRRFDVVTFLGFARVANEIARDYSKVNFALF